MLGELVAPRFLVLYAFVASAAYVHLRGRVRHRLQRQLTDHSTVFAPLNVIMYAASAVPRTPLLDPRDFPELAVLRDHWREIRAEAEALLRRGEVRPSEAPPRRRLQHVLRARLAAISPQVVRRLPALGAGTLPAHRRPPALGAHGARRAVRAPAGGRQADRAPRSLRRLAALPPRPHHAQLRRLPHLRRRRAVRLARRRGRGVRRDVHPSRREPHRPGSHHPVLRRRAAAAHARDARAEPVHRELRAARHREPERADGAHRPGESRRRRRCTAGGRCCGGRSAPTGGSTTPSSTRSGRSCSTPSFCAGSAGAGDVPPPTGHDAGAERPARGLLDETLPRASTSKASPRRSASSPRRSRKSGLRG